MDTSANVCPSGAVTKLEPEDPSSEDQERIGTTTLGTDGRYWGAADVECGYSSPWPPLTLPELDPVTAAAWGRKLYPGPGRNGSLMFGLHHHQDASAGGLHHHHHHHQPRGPVTGLKEEPLSTSQLAAARSWMQPSVVDQSRLVLCLQFFSSLTLKEKEKKMC